MKRKYKKKYIIVISASNTRCFGYFKTHREALNFIKNKASLSVGYEIRIIYLRTKKQKSKKNIIVSKIIASIIRLLKNI